MSDKELIKQEIERRINDYKNWIEYQTDSNYLELKELLQFINSLPEEPVSEDLEEVSEVFYDNCHIAKSSWWDEDVLHKMSESKETFIAGAEWQKQKDQETIELAEDHAMLAGMNKIKEEMMKNAVEAIVYQGLYSKYIKERDDKALANVLKNYNSGDKVKIIIVKEE